MLGEFLRPSVNDRDPLVHKPIIFLKVVGAVSSDVEDVPYFKLLEHLGGGEGEGEEGEKEGGRSERGRGE